MIASCPARQEREPAKVGSLTVALALALRRRGIADGLSTLAAQMGMAALTQAVTSWLDDDVGDLDAHLVRAFDDVRALATSASLGRREP